MRALYLKFFWAALALTMSSASLAANNLSPQGLTLQGTILTSAGQPEEAASVVFTIQVMSPSASGCLLYSETQTLNMSSTSGAFALTIGSGTRTGSGFQATSTLAQVFSNMPGTISSLTCTTGSSYSPASSDSRNVVITFNDGSGQQTFSQVLTVESAPYSLFADQATTLQGMNPTNFLQTNTTTTQTAVDNLLANSNFMTFAGGSNFHFMSQNSNGTEPVPTATGTPTSLTAGEMWYDSVNNEMKYYNGTSTQIVGVAGAGLQNLTAGTGLTPTGAIASGSTLAVNVGTGANQIVQLNSSSKLPAVDGSQLTNVAAALATSSVTTTGTITAANFSSSIDSTNALRLYKGTTNYVTLQASSSLSTNPTLTLPTGVGSASQVLETDGTGVLSWNYLGITNIRSTVAGNAQFFPLNCSAGQTLTYQAVTDTFICTNIAVSGSSITGVLPIANGGTDNGSLAVTNGGVLYTDGTEFQNSGAGISGEPLLSGGAGAPTWSTVNLAGGNITMPASGNITNASGAMTVSATTNLNLQPAGGNVGIGTTAPSATLQITSPSASTGLMVTQTNANDLSTTMISNTLTVNPASQSSGDGNTVMSNTLTTPVGSSGGSSYTGLQNSLAVADTSAANVIGESTSATGRAGSITGSIVIAQMHNNGAAVALDGVSTTVNTGTGTLSSATGLGVSMTTGATTITNMYGLNIGNTNTGATISNNYGIYIGALSTASTQYSIYASDANSPSYFAGNLGIGTTSPKTSLDLSSHTDAIALPSGTTAQESTVGTLAAGEIRYNTTTSAVEFYNGSAWMTLSSSGSGSYLSAGGGTLSGGLTVSTGGETITAGGLTVSANGESLSGGLNNNSGGITNAGTISGASSISAASTGTLSLGNSTNGTSLQIQNIGSTGADYVTIDGSAAGGTPTIGTGGSDTNINLALMPKGTGSVGIGTTGPVAPLNVVGSTTSEALLLIQNTNAGAMTAFTAEDNTGTKYMSVGVVNSSGSLLNSTYGLPGEATLRASSASPGVALSSANGYIRFLTGNASAGTEQMRITNAGNVGIGTTSPSAMLDVHGGAIVADSIGSTSANINVSTGNVQVSSVNASTINICGVVDGGAYTVILTGIPAATSVTVNGYTTYGSPCTGAVTVDLGGGATTFTTSGNTNIMTFVYTTKTTDTHTLYGFSTPNFNVR
jgi:trimeric autotransporter adhesin